MPQQDAAAYFHLHRLYPYSLQNQLISGLFDAENCHIRRLLSLVLKSVDFGAKKAPVLPLGRFPWENTHAAL